MIMETSSVEELSNTSFEIWKECYAKLMIKCADKGWGTGESAIINFCRVVGIKYRSYLYMYRVGLKSTKLSMLYNINEAQFLTLIPIINDFINDTSGKYESLSLRERTKEEIVSDFCTDNDSRLKKNGIHSLKYKDNLLHVGIRNMIPEEKQIVIVNECLSSVVNNDDISCNCIFKTVDYRMF